MAAVGLLVAALAMSLHTYWIYNGTVSSLLQFALSIALFVRLSLLNASTRFKRHDRRLGDFTYALYLLNGLVINLFLPMPIGGAS
jgi:peptidoglycan/LPS O-acetylase OafA/YrhL